MYQVLVPYARTRRETVTDVNVENQVYMLLNERPKYRSILEAFVKVHEEQAPTWEYESQGIEWKDVPGAGWQPLSQMAQRGILRIVHDSNKHTVYRLANPEATKRVLQEIATLEDPGPQEQVDIGDLFAPVSGYDEIKDMFRLSLLAPKPVHILLVGPPASAKSLFLTEITRLPQSVYVEGAAASRAGITEYLLENKPKYLLIDELDLMKRDDFSALRQVMEDGRIGEMKYGRHQKEVMDLRVYAAANTEHGIPKPTLSRFMRFWFRPYNEAEFCEAVRRVLALREGVTDVGLADRIAYASWHETRSRDVREAIRISRLASTMKGVDTVVKTLLKYGPMM